MSKLFFIFLIISMPCFASQSLPNRPDNSQKKINSDKIEIVEGTPRKSFKKLQPVWATSVSFDAAMKKIKRQAAKAGADAIIEIEVVTDTGSNSGGGINKAFALFASESGPQPVVRGWAVKWE